MVKLNFKNSLIAAVTQDYKTGRVLMLAYMNEEAWKKTLETGRVWYYSRSRDKLWMKGKTSGNIQEVKEILIDCDKDAVLLRVNQVGNAPCHKGYDSCFFTKLDKGKLKIVGKRLFDPGEVYRK